MILAHFGGNVELGAEKRSHFGNKFFGGIGLVAETLTQLARQA